MESNLSITANQLRKKYLDFFKEKGHAIIPSAPVVPENDPTVLFTTAGMHPLVPYLMGEKHPQGKRLADVQKCIRTPDIDDVGDNRHLTFFEMLGNWSLGDYFKEEAIKWSWEFLTDSKWLGIDPERIYVTVFAGDKKVGVDKDEESIEIWKEQFRKAGLTAEVCLEGEKATEKSRIFLLGMEDNFWGPAGQTGPCGPCTEMFFDVSPQRGSLAGKTHQELVDEFRLMEIWNDVFMEFNKTKEGKFEKLSQQNVDTGMGLERTITILNGKENVFETELFLPIIGKIEELSQKNYQKGEEKIKRSMRIISDHLKAAVFIVADGIEPSNTERGYVLRRLIRRAIRQGHILGIEKNFVAEVAEEVVKMYQEIYPETGKQEVIEVLRKEEEKFRKTLERGLREFDKISSRFFGQTVGQEMPFEDGKIAFNLFQSFGFPLEMFFEELENRKVAFDKKKVTEEFQQEYEKHQELSRTASAGMFKGGLADTQEKTKQLHTTAHLMLAGLRKVLGEHVHQKGSNINGERIRFDFSHPEKMTEEEKAKVEKYVNEAINSETDVVVKEMSLEEARKNGAEGAFENKYGERVKVYEIGKYSKEICGGPHVKNTSEIKGRFRIVKEQSSSAGVRRIKAVLEK